MFEFIFSVYGTHNACIEAKKELLVPVLFKLGAEYSELDDIQI